MFSTKEYNDKTLSIKKFNKLFDDKVEFICLTDKESEEDEDYTTGLNTGITFTTTANFLNAVYHLKVPNIYYRPVESFIAKTEVYINRGMFRVNRINLGDKVSFTEAPFLKNTKMHRRIRYCYEGALYLLKNNVPIPKSFCTYLLRMDESLLHTIKDTIDEETVKELIGTNPYLIKFFPERRDLYDTVISTQPYTLQYLAKPSDSHIENALKLNGTAIQFVEEPTEQQAILAVEQNYMAIKNIPQKFRTPKVIKLAQTLLSEDDTVNISAEKLI